MATEMSNFVKRLKLSALQSEQPEELLCFD